MKTAFGFLLATLAVVVLAGFIGCAENTAHADGFTSGPTVPLTRFDFTSTGTKVSALGSGAGYALSYGLFPRVIQGVTWDMLQIELAGFVGHSSVDNDTSISAAALVCSLSGLICAGGGRDLYRSIGATDWFALVTLGFNFGLLSSTPPVTGGALSPPPPQSANTVELPF